MAEIIRDENHLSQLVFFLDDHNSTGQIRDQCCHLQSDRALVLFFSASTGGEQHQFCLDSWVPTETVSD